MTETPMNRTGRRIPLFAMSAALLAAGCASAPTFRSGNTPALAPSFVVPEGRPIKTVSVNLGQAAYVTMVYVVPGRGALVVLPSDSTTYNHLDAGTHELSPALPHTPNRDSLFAAERRRQRQGGHTPSPLDTTQLGRLPGEANPEASPVGELLLFVSPAPLPYAVLKARVEGITIPNEDRSAVNTVINLIRAALPEGTPWAAYARQIDLEEG